MNYNLAILTAMEEWKVIRWCVLAVVVSIVLVIRRSREKAAREKTREYLFLFEEICRIECSLNESNIKETAEKLASLLPRVEACCSAFTISMLKRLLDCEREQFWETIRVRNQMRKMALYSKSELFERLYSEYPGTHEKVLMMGQMMTEMLERK